MIQKNTQKQHYRVSPHGLWRHVGAGCVLALVVFGSAPGCTTHQVHASVQHRAISLKQSELQTYGLAFITPSTVTGQEEDKQALALTFAEVLVAERPAVRCVTLSETLGAINRAGLAEEYRGMYEDYRNTGIFKRDILQKVGEATGTRYLAQLKLAGFTQGSQSRWGFLGIRMIDTKYASIRLFLQIWDSEDGTIAWEGIEELNYAFDTSRERAVTFKTVVETTARNLIAHLP